MTTRLDQNTSARPASIRRLVLPVLAAGALLFAACGDDDDTAASDTTEATAADDTGGESTGGDSGGAAQDGPVDIVDFTYEPTDIVATPGQELEFTNGDGTAHTATATDNSFDTGSIQGGESGTATAPSEPGDYPFFCSFHPFMKGTLTVQ